MPLPYLRPALAAFALVAALAACGKKAAEQQAEQPSTVDQAQRATPEGACKPGLERKGSACVDIDECSYPATPCGTPLATCTNKEGGYECACPRGFAGGGLLGIGCAPRVVAASASTCALPEEGQPLCWGAGFAGTQAFEYPEWVNEKPEPLENMDRAVAIVSGLHHACILRSSGIVACWGHNEEGQLGEPSHPLRPWAFDVPGLEEVANIDAGATHTCAVTRFGALWCWGGNHSQELGVQGDKAQRRPVRVDVPPVVDVATGASHTCVLLRDGSVRCWGANYGGQLGNGKSEQGATPAKSARAVPLPGPATLITEVGALLRDGRAFWWGSQEVDTVRETGPFPRAQGPTQVRGVDDAVFFSADNTAKFVLRRDGSLWGQGYGSFGSGFKGRSTEVPVKLGKLERVLSFSRSASHSCALGADGACACWGGNRHRELGLVRGDYKADPVTCPKVSILRVAP